jgi:hypothetical protein
MTPFEQKCHADLLRKMAGCTPCTWHVTVTITKTESKYNRGDPKPPITHHCLQGLQAPAFSNIQVYPSLLIVQEMLGHPDVSMHPHIASSGTPSCWLCGFDACGQSLTWHLILMFDGH